MFLSFILIALITVGGLSLTYLIAEDETLLWRVSAGNVFGLTVFGLVSFVLACLFGFSAVTVGLSILISLAPVLLLFYQKPPRARFGREWQKAKGKLEGANFKKLSRFAYYAFFFILFCLFFERAILVTPDGILTGASQNYGDLPFHLGAIFSFTDGNNFPPENPSYAFAKFSYPFMADLLTAAFVKLGAGFREATYVQNVWLAFSLLVVLERFAFKLTGSKLAGKIAPVLLFFSGGLGFLWFLKDYWEGTRGIFELLNNLPRDYTISGDDKNGTVEIFRWGNSLVVLFVTQRSLLLGMPLTIIVLQKLWKIFSNEPAEIGDQKLEVRSEKVEVRDQKLEGRNRKSEIKNRKSEVGSQQSEIGNRKSADSIQLSKFSIQHSTFSIFLTGLLAGTLPLVHVHSLAVLFVVTGFLFFFRIDKLREWIVFGIGVAVVAVPELIWVMTGSATRLTEFIDWNFGWDKGSNGFFWFWLKNTGAFLPVLIFGVYLIWEYGAKDEERVIKEGENYGVITKKSAADSSARDVPPIVPRPLLLLMFYLPFLAWFFIANAIKLAPWQWDNVKVLVYWFVGSLPIAALVLAWAWNRSALLKIAAAACLFVLIFAGALDVWRTISGEIEYNVFSRDSVAIAELIKKQTAPNAMFLNAPTFNSAVVLSGRRSVMRFTGHLLSYGIDYGEREADVRKIYAGDGTAEVLLGKYNVEYIIISPEEKDSVTINEEFFRRFPLVMEVGQHRIYQVKK